PIGGFHLNPRRLNGNLFADSSYPESNIKNQAVRGIHSNTGLFCGFEAGVRCANGKSPQGEIRKIVCTVGVRGEVARIPSRWFSNYNVPPSNTLVLFVHH